MKHLKKFEAKQEIKKKDLNETIDEILDSLNKKGKLSKSENEFMIEVSNNTIKNVTIPQMTGNIWADMSNPHNIGVMYQGKDDIWKRLISLEEEEEESLEEIEDSDERYERKRILNAKKYLKQNPGLKEELDELLKNEVKVQKKCDEIRKKYRKPYNDENHNFNQSLDYAISGKIEGLINNFGIWGEEVEDNQIINPE